jgi:hypothetical protein
VNRRSNLWVFANLGGQRDGHILEKLTHFRQRGHIEATAVHALRHCFGMAAQSRLDHTTAVDRSIQASEAGLNLVLVVEGARQD